MAKGLLLALAALPLFLILINFNGLPAVFYVLSKIPVWHGASNHTFKATTVSSASGDLVRKFVRSHLEDDMMSNNLDAMMENYADSVKFHGKTLSRNSIRAEREGWKKDWPNRRGRIIGDIKLDFKTEDAKEAAVATFVWRHDYVGKGGSRTGGLRQDTWVIASIDGRLRIAAERSKKIDATEPNLPPHPQLQASARPVQPLPLPPLMTPAPAPGVLPQGGQEDVESSITLNSGEELDASQVAQEMDSALETRSGGIDERIVDRLFELILEATGSDN